MINQVLQANLICLCHTSYMEALYVWCNKRLHARLGKQDMLLSVPSAPDAWLSKAYAFGWFQANPNNFHAHFSPRLDAHLAIRRCKGSFLSALKLELLRNQIAGHKDLDGPCKAEESHLPAQNPSLLCMQPKD